MKYHRTTLAGFLLLFSTFSWGQWQVAEISGPAGIGSAISVSGPILAALDTTSGTISVFQSNAQLGWKSTTQVATLQTSDNSQLRCVAIGDAGKVIVAGSGGYEGKAYVFVEPTNGWANATETAILTPSDGVMSDYFGYSVAINGPTILVGAPGSESQPGAAYVYIQPQSGWVSATQTAKLTPSDSANNDLFGYFVSVYGFRIAITEPAQGGSTTGGLYVFQEPVSGWINMTESAALAMPNTSGGDCQNYFAGPVSEVAGTVVAVGNYCVPTKGSPVPSGVGYLYEEQAGGWVNGALPNAILTMSGDRLGSDSIAMSANTVVIGDPGRVNPWQDYYGSAFVFYEPQGGWQNATQNMRLVPKYTETEAGMSVAFEQNRAFLGAPETMINGSMDGAVFVYTAKHP